MTGKVLEPIFERITICSDALGAITEGAPCIMAFTVSMPALTGGFEKMQLNFVS